MPEHPIGEDPARTEPPRGGSLRTGDDHLLAASRVGIVPIHWEHPPSDTDEYLEELDRLGFVGVQSSPHLPSGEELREHLQGHGMRLAEVYAALPCTPDGPGDDAYEVGRTRLGELVAGGGDVLVGALDGTIDRDGWAGRATGPDVPRLTDAGWRRLTGLVDLLAADTVEAGCRFAFHPHAATYVETSEETDHLLAETDPATVGLCLDTGHHIVGGGDPTELIDRIGSRVVHVHLKDVDPGALAGLRAGEVAGFIAAVDRRVFSPLGSGSLDLASVLTALDGVGYQGWLMIEQDSSWEPPAEAAAISRRVLAWALRHLAETRP